MYSRYHRVRHARRGTKYVRSEFKLPKIGGRLKLRWQQKALLVLFAVTFIGGIYWLYFSPFFIIRDVQTINNYAIRTIDLKNIYNDYLKKHEGQIFREDNIMALDSQALAQDILAKYIVDDLKINKRYFSRVVEIYVKEKEPVLTLVSGNKYYYFDKTGVVFREIPVYKITLAAGETSGAEMVNDAELDNNLYKVVDLAGSNIELNQKYLVGAKLEFLINLTQTMRSMPEFTVKEFRIPNVQMEEMQAVLDSGIIIYFNSVDSLSDQIERLKLVWKNKSSEIKEYINLKYGEKVWVK